MKRRQDQRGFAHLGLIVVLIIMLAIVAFAFWRVQDQPAQETTDSTNSQEADTIDNSDDLEAVEEELKQTDIDGELNVEELDSTLE